MQSGDPKSTLSIYKRLAALRQEAAFLNANVELLEGELDDRNILAYIRSDGTQRYIVVMNFGYSTSFSLDKDHTKGVVKVATKRLHNIEGQGVDLNDISLEKGDGLVIQLV